MKMKAESRNAKEQAAEIIGEEKLDLLQVVGGPEEGELTPDQAKALSICDHKVSSDRNALPR
jgi:hypothetical protein